MPDLCQRDGPLRLPDEIWLKDDAQARLVLAGRPMRGFLWGLPPRAGLPLDGRSEVGAVGGAEGEVNASTQQSRSPASSRV